MECGRFAPSTTGRAHPGTLLSALLAWLDCRRVNGRFILRLEDLDRERCLPQWNELMVKDLQWLGLDWDCLEIQSQQQERYREALNILAQHKRLYVCRCSRREIKQYGQVAADGGFVYPGTCRANRLDDVSSKCDGEVLRCHLDDMAFCCQDELGEDLSIYVGKEMGDPVVRRRDGFATYQLASVVDDGLSGITRIVRGRDIVPSTAIQIQLQHFLGFETPIYFHHLLLLETQDDKLAKLHQSVSCELLRQSYTAEQLCGFLAFASGLIPEEIPMTPSQLLEHFSWQKVRRDNVRIVLKEQKLYCADREKVEI